MNPRKWIRIFFGFSRAQTNGFIILLPLLAVLIFSAPVYQWWISRQPRDFSKERILLDSLTANWQASEVNTLPVEEEVPVRLFEFNPNSASLDELRALGFSAGLTNRLINYRNKGGQFRVKQDLLRLYGMDSSFYKILVPFINLPETLAREEKKLVALPPGTKRPAPVKFDLNRADTTLLKTIYGIGSKISTRIVNYRESMGGFISRQQVYEIYGLDSAVVLRLDSASFIQPDFQVRTLNINQATEGELVVHPYISKRMATAIVTYRFQHGRYEHIDDLRKIVQLDAAQLEKLKPYLTVD
ncbi:MAG: helix-hairpin-helix domain-containing protein [Cyclobacteriaceae bacterium]|nr:helix-hairpin-helix domain-containing protein [Cyclobacteriaceae bacterium]